MHSHHHHHHRHSEGRDFHPGRGRNFFKYLSEALLHHASSRHGPRGRGHRGHGHGGPFGGDFGGDDGLPRGRRFSSEDLQLLLLLLLADKPSHGYELTKALEERSLGSYKPSPGMIYPALTYLEEIGYATVEVVANKKSYQLSAEGRTFLETHRERAEFMLAKITEVGQRIEAMQKAFAERGAAGASDDSGGTFPAYLAARRTLKHLLMSREHSSLAEQERIAAILEGAISAIRQGRADSGDTEGRPSEMV